MSEESEHKWENNSIDEALAILLMRSSDAAQAALSLDRPKWDGKPRP